MKKQLHKTDFMAIGAHADDVELLAGGTVAKLRSLGKTGIIVDMTDSSAGTRGSPAIRQKEAEVAARVLNIPVRINLGFPDTLMANTWNEQKRIVELIRKYRPKAVLTHFWKDEHPDHETTGLLVKAACYKSGLAKLDSPGSPFRPQRIFYFMGPEYFDPVFCVDISDFWNKKIKAVLCYKSQFFNRESGKYQGKTDIAKADFLEYLETKARFFGWRIKRKYAEPFYCAEIPEVHNLTDLGGRRF